jgi:hypothetical protein
MGIRSEGLPSAGGPLKPEVGPSSVSVDPDLAGKQQGRLPSRAPRAWCGELTPRMIRGSVA